MSALSIKELYAYALVEGEGVGTAYEYFAKRRVMRPVLERLRPGEDVLIAGLPEKYGTSLDFVLAAHERGCACVVVDDRPHAIEKAKGAVAAAQAAGRLARAHVRYETIDTMADVARVPGAAAVLSCEVLQRLSASAQRDFARALRAAAPAGVVFVPNSENGSHLKISGLGGFSRAGLSEVMNGARADVGFTDMPPFPPGITRSEDQRARASSGTLEAIAMYGLEWYCRAERAVPAAVKRRLAHIVWARWGADLAH
jgi:hypothetical protein